MNWLLEIFLKHKGEFLNPDLWSRKIKVIFEYDGIWHFKDIKGQLKNKQRKDALLEDFCLANDWRLVRIKEDRYLEDKDFWINKVKNTIYNNKDHITKYY